MAVTVKKYAERFADTEISRIFAMPNHHIKGYSPAVAIFSGYLCGGAITRTGGLATLQRGVRFLCVHTKRLLSTLCQTTTKAQSPRITVTGAPTSNGNSCILMSCKKIKSTPTPCRYRVEIDGSSPYYAIGKSVCEFFNEFPQCGYINRVKIYGAVER